MARVTRRLASVLARRAPSRTARRNARRHKVIMESVTQAKKKLRSVISFEAKAPPGYTFIPAGNPQLTTACKELCRKDGLKVFAVTIIKTAFQKGQRKVGTAVELPLARRAQLAVVAHIRHIYTDYDRLLKTTSFHEARSTVEEPTLAKLVEWRGDDENGKTVLEDVFREVIVISDDDDSDVEGDAPESVDRDYSVEIVSSKPCVEELQTKPVNYANPSVRGSQIDISEDEAPPGFRYVREVPRKRRVDRRGFSRYQAWDRAINRYRNMAHEAGGTNSSRLHDGAADNSRSLYSVRQPLEPAPYRALGPRNGQGAKPTTPNPASGNDGMNRSMLGPSIERRPYELYSMVERPHQGLMASLSDRVPLERGPALQQEKYPFQQANSPNAPVFVGGPREVHEEPRSRFRSYKVSGPYPSRTVASPQERVLPSIEAPPADIRRPDSGPLDHLAQRLSGGFSIRSLTPHRPPHKDIPLQIIEDRVQEQAPKRRRVAYYEPTKPYSSHPGITSSTVAEPHTGEQYIRPAYFPAKQIPPQDEPHLSRRYAAPVNPLSAAQSRPEDLQDTFLDTIQANTDSGIIMHHRRLEDLERQPVPHGRLAPVHEIPGQSYDLPATGFAVLAEKGHKRMSHMRPSDQGDQRIYSTGHPYNAEGVKPSQLPRSHEPSLRIGTYDRISASHELPQRRHYADDFVRAIDLREPIQLDSPLQRRLQTNNSPESQSNIIQSDDNPYRPNPPGSIAVRPSGRTNPDSPIRPGTHIYAVVDDRVPKHHNSRLLQSQSAAPRYERAYEGPLDYWQTYEQFVPEEQSRPTYVGRVEPPQPQYPVPGRRAVIVD
ncbi:DUF2293 domain-containing protein [Aspergillus tanneri]|uniref:DUF2293 domain-containing protein n=1 Tax=Aspergillus tanneri TaxID=1220188 RepID=A0A5M9N3U1_9EURO|nr:uncharacterized protein ATNIH1004_001148 [Aspergillus tanneri]KAA8652244.1 hypothetical protein ATNIH1004_001148 [Aspergillus tanneri]